MSNNVEYTLDTQAVTNFYKGVIKFNEVAGGTRENYDHQLQMKLMEEEWQETLKAYNDKNPVEFLDGMLDVLVTHGYAWQMNEVESVFKGSWEGVETKFSSVVEQGDWPERFDIMEQFCATLKHKYGVDIEGAMAEVNRSNMSKFCDTSERSYFHETLVLRCEDIRKEGRYTGVGWEMKGNYIVFKDGNGKVMKGPDFTAPDLTPYVGNLSKLFEEDGSNGRVWMSAPCSPAGSSWVGFTLPRTKPNLDDVITIEDLFGELITEAEKVYKGLGVAQSEDEDTKQPEQITAKVSSAISFTPEEVDVIFELLCMTHTEDGAAHSAMAKLESYASDESLQRLETCDQRFTSVDTATGFELNKEGHITLLEKNNDEGGI